MGAYQQAAHDEARERHLALPMSERLSRSWELYLAYRDSANLSARQDDPSAFYDRARELGLYRP